MYEKLKRNRALRKSLIVPLSGGLASVATFAMFAIAVITPDVFALVDDRYSNADSFSSKVILGTMGGFVSIGAIILWFSPVVVALVTWRRWWRQLCAEPSESNNPQEIMEEAR